MYTISGTSFHQLLRVNLYNVFINIDTLYNKYMKTIDTDYYLQQLNLIIIKPFSMKTILQENVLNI